MGSDPRFALAHCSASNWGAQGVFLQRVSMLFALSIFQCEGSELRTIRRAAVTTSWRLVDEIFYRCTRLLGGTSSDGFLQRIQEPCSSNWPRALAQLSPLTFHSTHVARVVRSSIIFPMGLRVCLWLSENFFGASRMRPRMRQLLFCIQAPWPQLLVLLLNKCTW